MLEKTIMNKKFLIDLKTEDNKLFVTISIKDFDNEAQDEAQDRLNELELGLVRLSLFKPSSVTNIGLFVDSLRQQTKKMFDSRIECKQFIFRIR